MSLVHSSPISKVVFILQNISFKANFLRRKNYRNFTEFLYFSQKLMRWGGTYLWEIWSWKSAVRSRCSWNRRRYSTADCPHWEHTDHCEQWKHWELSQFCLLSSLTDSFYFFKIHILDSYSFLLLDFSYLIYYLHYLNSIFISFPQYDRATKI